MKLGNKEPAPKPAKAEAWTDPDRAPARDAAWLDGKTEAELADLDEEEFDDDRFLESYRRASWIVTGCRVHAAGTRGLAGATCLTCRLDCLLRSMLQGRLQCSRSLSAQSA